MKSIFFMMSFLSLILASSGMTAEKSPEEKLTRKKCSSCHNTPRQGKLIENELESAVTEHGRKLRRLTEEEKMTIINYLKKS